VAGVYIPDRKGSRRRKEGRKEIYKNEGLKIRKDLSLASTTIPVDFAWCGLSIGTS
jgi:hypothetical protein